MNVTLNLRKFEEINRIEFGKLLLVPSRRTGV